MRFVTIRTFADFSREANKHQQISWFCRLAQPLPSYNTENIETIFKEKGIWQRML